MHVIGQQYISMNPAIRLVRGNTQQIEIHKEIGVAEETLNPSLTTIKITH